RVRARLDSRDRHRVPARRLRRALAARERRGYVPRPDLVEHDARRRARFRLELIMKRSKRPARRKSRTASRRAAARSKKVSTATIPAPRVVKVPKTPPSAYNSGRPPSSLLLAQLAHLQWAALPAGERSPGVLPTQKVATEGEAADRIAELTQA